MHPLLLAFRLLHIICGVLWVGFAVFVALFLTPSLADLGPDAGKLMAALQRRGMMTLLPILALVTILSGGWLMWRVAGEAPDHFMAGPQGMALSFGGLLAVLAFIGGITVARPAAMRTGAALQALQAGPPPAERERLQALMERSRRTVSWMGMATAVLLLLSAGSMAVARYL